MCLIAFAYNHHPKYPLILAANRDEFYQRPTRAAQFWKKEGKPQILAGKDLKAGGTWLGIHTDGRWGALTNYRDPSVRKEKPPTRGELVIDYLDNDEYEGQSYLKNIIHPKSDRYNGFNLLIGDSSGLYHYSNIEQSLNRIDPGIHGISNALLDTPWPKLETAKKNLSEVLLQTRNAISKEDLFGILENEHQAADEDLPDTGIPGEWEKAVSSIFIKTENYGTRCSTLLLVDKEGTVEFAERRFEPGTQIIKEENRYRFKISQGR